MPKTFKIDEHVRWNSEAGRVSGIIIKKVTSDMRFKGYVHHASREAPQYLIKHDHVVIEAGQPEFATDSDMLQKTINGLASQRADFIVALAKSKTMDDFGEEEGWRCNS